MKQPEIIVQLHHPRWKTVLRPYCKTVRDACAAVLANADARNAEMTVVLADDAFIRDLNKTYRGKNKATNVLAFPAFFSSPLGGEQLSASPEGTKREAWGVNSWLQYPPRLDHRATRSFSLAPPQEGSKKFELGDLVLALETIEREAAEQGKTVKNHARHLLVHGTLHLLGYDHERKKDAAHMEALEIKILETLGVSNPYL